MSILLFLILYSLSFLVFGLVLGLEALKRRLLPKEFLYIGAIAASLTMYYGIFYLYLVWPRIGSVAVKLVMLASFALFVKLIVDFRRSAASLEMARKFFLTPLAVTVVVMFVYTTVFYSCVSQQPSVSGYKELNNQTFCHTSDLPFDNSLAFIFGGNILNNQDKKLAIDWHMVDRPPLQIAAVMPILDQGADHSQFIKYYSYQLFSMFLQLSWVAAVWGAFQLLKLNKKFQTLAFVALGATGFFYINSVFVWPKLLSAALVFTAILSLLGKNKPSRYRYWPFAALLVSLGLLSHTGVLFTLIPFVVYYLFTVLRGRTIPWKQGAIAAAVVLLMLVPWFAYKDSSVKTDRLTKWHFAGVISADDKRGTVETIIDQYKRLSFHDWARTKGLNVEALFNGTVSPTPGCRLNTHALVDKCVFKEWRTLAFFSTFFAFEALSLGWLAVIYRFARSKADLLDKELAGLILAGLAIWVLMMFIPGATVVHQGSYATMMLAFLLILKKLSELPRAFIGGLAFVQVAIFYLVWITPYFKVGP